MNSHIFFFFMFYNKKRSYDLIDYAYIDEAKFWIINEDDPYRSKLTGVKDDIGTCG